MSAKYLFIASMDVDADREGVFHDVYDREHIPNLLTVPGVRRVARYESEAFDISLGGEVRHVPVAEPRFHALYEIDSPDVLVSRSWADAVERGRWPSEVRPFTTNRKHRLYRRYGE